MANNTATKPAVNTPATESPAPKRRGRRPAAETGRVTVDLGVDAYAKLDEIRWDEREDSVGALVASIVDAWLAARG